uniref:TIL domain-containing protein n=1 Tax=Plectus sambesii TaxID=2011161 RepID=A0A914X5R7_9BILA
MKTAFLIAIAVVSVSSSTPPVNGGMSWCDYARAVGRDMTGCSNGLTGNIVPAPNTISSDPACTANIVCPSQTTCIRGQCVPLVGSPASEPPVSILPAPPQILPAIDPCAKVFCIAATTTCINGKCQPLFNNISSSCPANEELVSCSTCEISCGRPSPPCPKMCGPAKCECVASKGFARDSSGSCIWQSLCPTSSNTGNAVGCAAASCPAGQYCVEKQVQCLVKPCIPLATCVPTSG